MRRSRSSILLACFIACCAAAASPRAALALRADELVLVVNRNVPAGQEVADFYVNARHVPAGRVLGLNLPPGESIPFDRYERDVVPAVRKFLREGGLAAKVRCLVTVYGMPLRIEGKKTSDAEKQELAELREQIDAARNEALTVINATETLAQKLDPAFTPAVGNTVEELARRADVAIQVIARRAMGGEAKPPDAPEDAPARLFRAMQLLAGPAAVAQSFTDEQIAHLGLTPGEVQAWSTRRAGIEKARHEMIDLQDRRYDPAARAQLRDLSKDYFGCFGLLRLLQAQVDYLDNDGTAAALDSELSLTWWDFYSRSKWLPNLLHYRAREQGLDQHAPPVLMVCRLDAPKAETVRDGIILASLKAERDGLKGKFVIDSRGLVPGSPGAGKSQSAGFAAFDQTLRTLANLVRERTDLPLVMDDRDVVFPAEAKIDDVALYCGWYSVRKYVPAFEFTPGAVGYHIASFELVSLHTPNEKGWVAGLLNDGVSGTLGPVAEPYLHAFPLPNEFFPLLLTGRLTLAEVYWSTCPLNSWMLSLIGDPLYTPFKNHPEMTLDELPSNLRRALKMPHPAATQAGGPASGPATPPQRPATAPQRPATSPQPPTTGQRGR